MQQAATAQPGERSQYLHVMADGTVKQRHPISGNEVWTVPGRGNRPLGLQAGEPRPLDPDQHGRHCAFCEQRYRETPPEKERVVRDPDGSWRSLPHLPADELDSTIAEFRCIPNLFEILSYDYWHLNHGYVLSPEVSARRADYLASPTGREHVLAVSRAKLRASGMSPEDAAAMPDEQVVERASGFFGGGHDVVVARRHFVDGALDDSQLASAGTLTVEEHRHYLSFTLAALARLHETIPHARHVAVFQNWLKPAGASFDHLHKQLVAIDEYGRSLQQALAREIQEPDFFNRHVLDVARRHDLVLARNEHAIAIAGFGHRYPTIKVMSTSATCDPLDMDPCEVAAMSDLVHAVHAASGPHVPCNEEWHQRPRGIGIALPWHVNIKWRISTLAGFEGGTKININTIDPFTLRRRLLAPLRELREQGHIADMLIGEECEADQSGLGYAQHSGGRR